MLSLNDNGFDQISIEPVVLGAGDPLSIKESHLNAVNNEYEKLAEEYILRT